MPKERKARSVAPEIRCKASPYKKTTSSSQKNTSPEEIKEWDDVRCPICMEQPHNAVLLSCSSSDKGCRPFMCDTSYRHSNCLDQYRKAVSAPKLLDGDNSELQGKLTCPLCRGIVTGWTVVESARSYMNDKIRSCSKEECGFTGIYGELRKHARKDHPSERPAEADPERQRDWRRMEQQRDIADLFSMLRSVVTGDEVGISIEEDNEEERSNNAMVLPTITVLIVVRVRRSRETASGTRSSPLRGSLSPRSHSASSRRTRAFLWREGLSEGTSLAWLNGNDPEPSNQTLEEESEEVNEDGDAQTSRGRRRRRTSLASWLNSDEPEPGNLTMEEEFEEFNDDDVPTSRGRRRRRTSLTWVNSDELEPGNQTMEEESEEVNEDDEVPTIPGRRRRRTSLAWVNSGEPELDNQSMEEDSEDEGVPTIRGRRRRIFRMSDDEDDLPLV